MELSHVERAVRDDAFAGVVRIDGPDGTLVWSSGLADRRSGVPNTPDTRFAIASGTKLLTALVVMSLVDDGTLEFETSARSALGSDLPLVRDDVTVELLLGHRSGIGDYLDEELDLDVEEYVLTVPVHQLASTEDYLAVLDGHATKFTPGTRFAYSNSGYVVLALVAERVGGAPFAELVDDRVCRPAGLRATGFPRSDELPPDAAVGYLGTGSRGARTNVFHLPVRGSGDGGAYSTVADVHALWDAFLAGRIVSEQRVAEMLEPRGDAPGGARHYGLGVWLDGASPAVAIEGCDAGVSFRSVHHPDLGRTHTVVSNTTDGAWPLARLVEAAVRS